MLFVDKYRPTSLDKNDCHPELAANLKNLATSDDFPHLLFYGPSGSGKKTLIMSLLRELYGPGVEKLKIEPRSFKIATKSEPIEINIIASSYHIEMNPSDCGYYDRVVVQEVIKEIAQSQPLETSLTPQRRPYKIVILSEVDKMSKAAQHALRRTMEKYLATCRLIMTATSHARVTPAVLSRSLALRVARPSSSVLSALLSEVCRREHWSQGIALTPLIADKAERNIRRALLMLEVAKMKSGAQIVKTIELPDWEVFVQQLAKEIIDEQSPQKLLTLRSKLYELLVHCIPADVIIQRLTTALLERLDADLKVDVTHWAAIYEHRLKSGSKPIFHLEAFIAKCMALYKSYLVQSFGD